jgi:hypothetical protein
MDPYAKDVVDAGAKLVGLLGVLFAALSLFLSFRTRRQELRWRQATAARELLAEIQNHPLAKEAERMMDCHIGGHLYDAPTPEIDCKGVTIENIRAAIAGSAGNVPSASYIYSCFDWFLYYVDRIGYLARNSLLEVDDIAAPLLPYAKLLRREWTHFEKLVRDHGYDDASLLLRTLSRKH